MASIRNFDFSTECQNVEDLRNALQNLKGKSISIQFKKPSGINSTLMVDVDELGNLTESYGDKGALTFEQLCSMVFSEQTLSTDSLSPSWDDFESEDDLIFGEPFAVPKACSIDDEGCTACQ